ncbi:MAG: succinyl-diaminopimelate desuccinylase [Legionellaceae bacterium]
MNDVRDILKTLIEFKSITPEDAGCQAYLSQKLSDLGFTCESMDAPPVANLFARIGTNAPFLLFAGHTDVVPPGDLKAWHTDPFVLHENKGQLFGRGTADMKGSLAAMVVAAEQFLQHYPSFNGSLGFLITSGEEGNDFLNGTPHVMAELSQRNDLPTYCVVGEPSSTHHVGDVIKIGRRGSLTGHFTFKGKQGHVAYPHLAENPIHTTAKAISTLVAKTWDEGNRYFPPTTLQITHLQAGGEAGNVIPGTLTLHLNCRYSTEQTAEGLKKSIEQCFKDHGIHPDVTWQHNGSPFLTSSGHLLQACIEVIRDITGQETSLSTSGGTSDGRFIAPYGVEVIELGPVNATIHQANESIVEKDLHLLCNLYFKIMKKLLVTD